MYFKPEHRNFELTQSDGVLSWKSIGLSDEKIKSATKDRHPKLNFNKEKIYLTFQLTNTLAQEKVTYTHGSVIKLYVVYSVPSAKANPNDIMKHGLCGSATYDTQKMVWFWFKKLYTQKW